MRRFAPLHAWNVSPTEARALQENLRTQVIREDRLPNAVQRVAGVDVGPEEDGRRARAAVVVLGYPGLEPLETAVARVPVEFPYVPGLLSFREVPAMLAAFERLEHLPDLVLCDGQGLAHPRRLGLACHFGLASGLPTIGVAKSLLVGVHGALGRGKGSRAALIDHGETVGVALRTRDDVRPIYVSIGHRVGLDTAIAYVLRCVTRYRLPETTRLAHRLASGPAGRTPSHDGHGPRGRGRRSLRRPPP